jgi:hypothetical protein
VRDEWTNDAIVCAVIAGHALRRLDIELLLRQAADAAR